MCGMCVSDQEELRYENGAYRANTPDYTMSLGDTTEARAERVFKRLETVRAGKSSYLDRAKPLSRADVASLYRAVGNHWAAAVTQLGTALADEYGGYDDKEWSDRRRARIEKSLPATSWSH